MTAQNSGWVVNCSNNTRLNGPAPQITRQPAGSLASRAAACPAPAFRQRRDVRFHNSGSGTRLAARGVLVGASRGGNLGGGLLLRRYATRRGEPGFALFPAAHPLAAARAISSDGTGFRWGISPGRIGGFSGARQRAG